MNLARTPNPAPSDAASTGASRTARTGLYGQATLATLILLGAIVLLGAAFVWERQLHEASKGDPDEALHRAARHVATSMASHERLLLGLGSLPVDANAGALDTPAWQARAAAWSGNTEPSELLAVLLVADVPGAQRLAFEHAHGGVSPGFAVHPAVERLRHLPIVASYPAGRDGLGYDLAIEPALLTASAAAQGSSRPCLSAPVRVPSAPGTPVVTLWQRVAPGPASAPRAYVVAVVSLPTLAQDARAAAVAPSEMANLEIFDGSERHAAPQIFDANPSVAALSSEDAPVVRLTLAGRTWTLVTTPRAQPVPKYLLGVTLAGAAVLALLAGLMTWATAVRGTRALQGAGGAARLLREREAHLRAVVDSVADGIIVYDEHGRVQDFNAAAQRIFGLPASLALGQNVGALLPRLRPQEEVGLPHTPQTGRHMAGGTVPVEVAVTRTEQGQETLFVAVVRDITERAQAERALRESEERYRDLFENSSDLIQVLTPEGRFSYVNRAWRLALGYHDDELESLDMSDVLADDSRAEFQRAFQQARAGEALDALDLALRARDGRRLFVEGTLGARTLQGRLVSVRGLFRDVTARRREQALQAERARLDALRADVGSALMHGETLGARLQMCADALAQHLGVTFASLWTLDVSEAMLELQGGAGTEQLERAPRARIPVGELWIGRVAQQRRVMRLDVSRTPRAVDDANWAARAGMRAFSGFPLLVQGRVMGVMGMYSQAALNESVVAALLQVADEVALAVDRARALEALRISEGRTRSILDNLLTGLVTAGADGCIESVNPAAESIFGYPAAEILGRSARGLLAPDSLLDADVDALARTVKDALGRVTEWQGRRRSGELFPLELSLFTFDSLQGRRYAAVVRDVSERREIERLKDEFISTVSHELRTPLTSIRGALSLVSAGVLGELPHDAVEVLSIAERNAVRLVALINDILDLERLQIGQLEMRFEELPAATLLTRALDAVRAFAQSESVQLEVGNAEGVTQCDGDRVVQVLVNLLSNAIKFSPNGGQVRLSAAQVGNWVELRVADDGRGIPNAYRQVIFERFRQVHVSDTRQKGGTGLGLAISKAIVEQHGGAIGVESEEGHGSNFWVRLPAASSQERKIDDTGAWSQHEVLVVEDDEALRRVLVRQLAAGARVRSAADGDEALRLAEECPPDLIILDVGLPGTDGFGVVRALRQRVTLAQTPLLVYTGRDLGREECEDLRLGPTRVLTKGRATDADFRLAVVDLLDLGRASDRS